MKEEMTKEEEVLLEQVAQKWMEASLNNPFADKKININKEVALEYIDFVYKLAEVPTPKVVFTSSPVGNQIAANWIGFSEKERRKAAKKIFDDYDVDRICDGIHWEKSLEKEYKACKTTDSDCRYFEPYSVLSNSGWLSFYDFFKEIKIVDCEKFAKISDLAYRSGIWEILPFEEFCFVCGCPSAVVRNEEGVLHYDQGKAVEWVDGDGFYSLLGVQFDEPIWKKIVSHEFTLQDLSSLTNADQNAAAIGMLSPERLLEYTNARFMNAGIKGTKLYEVKNFMGRADTEYALLMTCQSTGRKFLEWAVDKEVAAQGDADAAHACSFFYTDDNGKKVVMSVEDYLTMEEA